MFLLPMVLVCSSEFRLQLRLEFELGSQYWLAWEY
jgi:hypothetical protein